MPYDTQLSPDEEKNFQDWKNIMAPKDSGEDYDFRGAFEEGVIPAANGHWPDTYKKPNHPTFSNESIYAKDHPDLAGHWQGDTYIKPSQPLFPNPPQPDPLFPEDRNTGSSPYSPNQQQTTSTLASLAQQRNKMSDDNLQSVISLNSDKIDQGREDEIRDQIAQARRTRDITNVQSLQSNVLKNPDQYQGNDLKALLEHEGALQTAPLDRDILETDGVQHMQDMAAVDPSQAAIQQDLQQNGDALNVISANVTKMQLWNREVDKMQQGYANEGILRKGWDFAASMIPFASSIGKAYALHTADSFWAQDLPTFKTNLPGVIDTIKAISPQPLETAKLFNGINNSDKINFGIGLGMDAATVVPWGMMAKFAQTPSKMARLLGNRALSSDVNAATILADQAGKLAPVPMQKAVDSIEESLPSAKVPSTYDLLKPDIGVMGDVGDKIDAVRKGMNDAELELRRAERLEPPQYAEAVQKAIDKASLEFKNDPSIVDYKEATRTEPSVYTTNPAKIMSEHQLEVARLESEGAQAASKMKGGLLPSPVAETSEAVSPVKNETPTERDISSSVQVTKDDQTGIRSLHIYMGKKSGPGGFISENSAKTAAVRRGFDLTSVDVTRNIDGQWFIKHTIDVPETGIATPVLGKADFKKVSKMGYYIKNPDNIMPELFNQARITATIGRSKLMEEAVNPAVKNIKVLSAASKKSLQTVLARGEEDQKWYNTTELSALWERVHGQQITDKEVTAYYTMKELNDLNYRLQNADQYIEKVRRGTVSASMDAPKMTFPKMNADVIDSPNWDGMRIYDATTGDHLKEGTNVDKLKAKWDTGDYKLLSLEEPAHGVNGDPVKFVMAHKDDVQLRPLDKNQLNYIEGGSRENVHKWFVKQAKRGEFSDGNTYWLHPKTHIAAPTQTSAQAWTEQMERARLAYINPELSDAAKRRIIEESPVENYDKFHQMVLDGEIQKKTPFETVYDRQLPKEMTQLREGDTRWFNEDFTGNESYYQSKGRMYYSAKGDRLRDPQGEYAEILDPYTTLHRAVTNATKTAAFQDYNRKVIEEWARVAVPFLDRRTVGNNLDPYNVFFHGVLDPNFKRDDPAFFNSLSATRDTHKRLMGFQTLEDTWRYQAVRNMSSWLEGKGPLGQRAAGYILNHMSGNPTQAVRGAVFDSMICGYDPGRVMIHSQNAFNAIAANPVYGAKAAAMAPWVKLLMVNHSENVLDYVSKRASMVHGFSPDEFKNMIRSLRTSGWMNVSGEMAQLDNFSNTVGRSMLGQKFKDIRYAGRLFLNGSEQFNRMTAYQIAWQKAREALPKEDWQSTKFQGLVNKLADDRSLNMTSSSKAYWQQGPLSVPAQFWTYHSRLLENMLPGWAGGNPRFSGAEKGRMLIGQLLMYGVKGAPIPGGVALYNYMADQYQEANGKQLDPTIYKTLLSGAWNTMYDGMTGADTDFAERAGSGAGWQRIWDEVFSTGHGQSIFQVMGGASGEEIGAVWTNLGHMTDYFKAEQVDPLDAETFKLIGGDLMDNISSLRHAHRMYSMMRYGFLKDPKTGQPVMDDTTADAWAAGLGIPLRKSVEKFEISKELEDNDNDAQDLAVLIEKNRRAAFQALNDGDMKQFDYYEKMSTGLLAPYRDKPLFQQRVLYFANQNEKKSINEWQGIKARLFQRTGNTPRGGQ